MYSYSDFILANQPMAYWRFNDPKNSKVIRDYSPNCIHLDTTPELRHKLGAQTLNTAFLKNDYFIHNPNLGESEIDTSVNCDFLGNPLVSTTIPKIVGRHIYDEFYAEFFCKLTKDVPDPVIPPGVTITNSNARVYKSGYGFLRLGALTISYCKVPKSDSDYNRQIIISILYPNDRNYLNDCTPIDTQIIVGGSENKINEIAIPDLLDCTVLWQLHYTRMGITLSLTYDNGFYRNLVISCEVLFDTSLIGRDSHYVQVALCDIANLSVFSSVPRMPKPDITFREISRKISKLNYSHKYDPFARTYRHGSQPFNITNKTILPFMLDDVLVYGSKQRLFNKIEIKDGIGKVWIWSESGQAYPKNPFDVGELLNLEGIPNPPCNQTVKLKQIVNSAVDEILVFDILMTDVVIDNFVGVVKQMPLSWDKSVAWAKSVGDANISEALPTYGYKSKGRLETQNLQQWISQTQGDYTDIQAAKSTFVVTANDPPLGETVPPSELFYKGVPQWWSNVMDSTSVRTLKDDDWTNFIVTNSFTTNVPRIIFEDPLAGEQVFVNIPEYTQGKTWDLPIIELSNKFKRGNKWYATWSDSFIRTFDNINENISVIKGSYEMKNCMLPEICYHKINYAKGVAYQFKAAVTTMYEPELFVEDRNNLYSASYIKNNGLHTVMYFKTKCAYLKISALLESDDGVEWRFVPNIKPSYHHVYGILCCMQKIIWYPESLCMTTCNPLSYKYIHNLEGKYLNNSQGLFYGDYKAINTTNYDMIMCVATDYYRYDLSLHFDTSFNYWNESTQILQTQTDLPIRKLSVITDNQIQIYDIFALYGYITPFGNTTYSCDGIICNANKIKLTMSEPLLYNTAPIEYKATLLYTTATGLIDYTPHVHALNYNYFSATSIKFNEYYYLTGLSFDNNILYTTTKDFINFESPIWLYNALVEINTFYNIENPLSIYHLTFTPHGVYFYDIRIVPNGDYHNATTYKFQKYKHKALLPIPKAIIEYDKLPLKLTKTQLFSANPLDRPHDMEFESVAYQYYKLFMYDILNDDNERSGYYYNQRLGLNRYDRLCVLNDAILYPKVSDDLKTIRVYQININDYVDCALIDTPESLVQCKMRELKLDKIFNPTQEPIWRTEQYERIFVYYDDGTYSSTTETRRVRREDVYFNCEYDIYDDGKPPKAHTIWITQAYDWFTNMIDDANPTRWYLEHPVNTHFTQTWKRSGNLLPIKEAGYYLDKNPDFNWDFNSVPEDSLTVFPLKGTKGVLTIESMYSALYYKNDTYPLEIEMTAVNGFAPYNFTIPNLPSTLTMTTGINKAMLTGFPTEDMDFEVVLTDNSTDTCTMRIKVQVSEIPTLDYMNRTEFTATDLPKGLTINPFTGEITGVVDYTGHKLNSMVYADVYRGNIKAKTTTTAIDFMVYRNPDSIEDFKCYKPQSLTENPLPINIHVPVLNLRISDYRSALGTIDINAADQYFHYHGIPDNYDVDKAGEIYRVNLDTVDVLTFKDVYFTTIKHIFVNPQSGVVYVLALAHSEIQAVFETSDFINFRLVPDFSPSFYLTQGKYEWHVSPFIDKWVAFAKPLNVEDISDVSHNIHVKLVDYMGDAIWQTVDFFSLTNGCVPLVIKFVNGILVVIAHDTVGLDRERRIFLSYDGLDFFEIEYPQKETEKDVQYFIDVIIGSNNGVYLIDKYNKFYILKNFWVYEVKYIHNPLSRFTSVCKQIEFIDGVLYAILENNTTQSDAPFYGTNGLFQISGFDNTSLYVDIKWLGFSVDKFYNINNHCYILYQGHLILIAPDSFVPCNTQTVPRYMKGIRNWKFHDPNPDLHIAIYGQQLLVYNNTGEMIRGELNNFDILTTVFEYINFAAPADLFYYFTESLNIIHINTTDFLRVQSEYTAPVLEEINTKSPMLLNYDGDGVGGELYVTPINWQEYLITSPNIPNKNVYWKANYKPEKITKSVYPYMTNVPYRLSTLKDTTYWTLIGDSQRFFLGMGWYHTSDSNHALLCFGGVKNLLKDNQHEWVLSGYSLKGVTQFNSDHLMNSDLFSKNIIASGHLLLTGKIQNKSDITLLVSSNEEGTKEYKRIGYTGSVIFPPLMIP